MTTPIKAITLGGLVVCLYLLCTMGGIESWLNLDKAESISLSILILAGFLWITEWIPLFVTSLTILGLQLVWLLPAIDPLASNAQRQLYLSPFFSDIILLFLGGFVLAAALHKYGIDQMLARLILKRTGTRPKVVLWGIMATSSVLSMWMSNTATTAMMLAIALPIIQRLPEGNPFAKALLISIPFACNLGGLATPIGTPPNAIAINYLAEKGIQVGFLEWMTATVPFLALFLFLLWFVLLKIYPPGEIRIELEEKDEHGLDKRHWSVLAVFGATVLAWLTTGFHGFSLGTVSLLPLLIFFGVGILKPMDFKMLPWDVLFMVGGGICLGVGLQQSGLVGEIVRLIPGGWGTFVILGVTALLTSLMTTFMSNTATANLLIPIAVSLDQPIAILVMTIAMCCSTAMSLPISTPPNAIAFGSGMIRSKDMILPGFLMTLIALFFILAAGTLYWSTLAIG